MTIEKFKEARDALDLRRSLFNAQVEIGDIKPQYQKFEIKMFVEGCEREVFRMVVDREKLEDALLDYAHDLGNKIRSLGVDLGDDD
jgi:hypothetical protein